MRHGLGMNDGRRRRPVENGVAALLMCGLVISCDGVALPDEPADYQGSIVEINPESGPPADLTIWVKETSNDECGVVYAIVSETEIVRSDANGDLDAQSAVDLEVGQHVRVWSGPVEDSCPQQSTANVVEILNGGS